VEKSEVYSAGELTPLVGLTRDPMLTVPPKWGRKRNISISPAERSDERAA